MEYYHIIIEKKAEKTKEKSFSVYAYDFEKKYLIDKIVKPYLQHRTFIVDGYALDSSMTARLKILATEEKINVLVSQKQQAVPVGLIMVWRKQDILESNDCSKDVTQQIIDEVNNSIEEATKEQQMITQQRDSKYIFIVHGHDLNRVAEIENFVYSLGFEPIVLFKEADAGQTIIEKIETYTSKACYGIILYTKCDYGYDAEHPEEIKSRARQNVVFEHGYLMAKLKRDHVCALIDGEDIETPGDISGIVYQAINDGGAWKYKIAQNMRVVGINVDMNKIK